MQKWIGTKKERKKTQTEEEKRKEKKNCIDYQNKTIVEPALGLRDT